MATSPCSTTTRAKPNEAYFKHVDWIVEQGAGARSLHWAAADLGRQADQGEVGQRAGRLQRVQRPRPMGASSAPATAKQPNIIWILGGDRSPENLIPIWSAMAAGIKEGDGGKHLITYHPVARHSSADWLHKEPWLDFNMMQSGHGGRDLPNYKMIAKDYALTPTKPVIDGEPRYENHPVNWQPDKKGWFDQFDVRQALYWSVFAGGAGVTYGCHDVWQMLAPGREPLGLARGDWKTSLDLPAAGQVQYLTPADALAALLRPRAGQLPDRRRPGRGSRPRAGDARRWLCFRLHSDRRRRYRGRSPNRAPRSCARGGTIRAPARPGRSWILRASARGVRSPRQTRARQRLGAGARRSLAQLPAARRRPSMRNVVESSAAVVGLRAGTGAERLHHR